MSEKVTKCGGHDKLITRAETAETGVHIETTADRYAASQLSQKSHGSRDTLYA
jgi:hypothetical protein